MASNSYGGGGNNFDPRVLLEGAAALGQGLFGSPEMMLQNRRLQINEQAAAEKASAFGSKQNLGDVVAAGLPRDRRGRAVVDPKAAREAAIAGDLPEYTGLIRGANEGVNQDIADENRLHVALLNATTPVRDMTYFDMHGGKGDRFDDYQKARAFSRQELALDTVLDNQRKLDFETQKAESLRGIYDVNHAPYAAAMRIYNDKSLPQEERDRQIEMLRSFLSASTGHVDPEAKAKAELNKERLRLETGINLPPAGTTSIAQAEQDIKTGGSIAETIAKGVADMTYPNASTPTGRTAILMDAAGLNPREQLSFSTDEEIRKNNETRSRLERGSPSPDTAEGARLWAMKQAGYNPQEAAAAAVGPISIPKGAVVAAMPGDVRLKGFTQASRGQTAREVLSLLSEEEMAAMPTEKLRMLTKAAEEQASGRPGAGALPAGPYVSGGTIWDNQYKPVPEKPNAELSNHVEALNAINGAIDAIQKNPKAFGPMVGVIGKTPLIGQPIQQQMVGPSGIQARADVYAPTAIRRHELFGGALTSGEKYSSQQFLPDETDSAASALAKLMSYKKATERQIEGLLNSYNQTKGYSAPDAADQAWKMIEPSIKQRAAQKNKGRK